MSDLSLAGIEVVPVELERPIAIEQLVGGLTTLVVLLRHGDCPFCELHLMRLARAAGQLGRIIAVSLDPPHVVRERAAGMPRSVLFVSDEQRLLYDAITARQAARSFLLHPRIWLGMVSRLLRGRRLMRRGADIRQLGADLLVDVDGRVLHVRRSRRPDDRPSVAHLLEWIESAPAASTSTSAQAAA